MIELEALPFDQYPRYRLVAELAGELRSGAALDVLDVGGRTGLLGRFLAVDRVTAVDVEAGDAPRLVLGDGARLPFADRSFDLVAAVDTLEHVPGSARRAFVTECVRVARRWVLLAGPWATERVDDAEEAVAAFLAGKLGVRHRYLAEHRDHGLPELDATRRVLEAAGARVAVFGHGNVDRWLAAMCLELYADDDPLLRPVLDRFRRFYNRSMFAADARPPYYRHALVGALAGASLPAGRALESAPAPPPDALAATAAFAREMLAHDRERDVWRPELERLRSVIAGLEKDLAEHRASLTERSAELAEHRSELARLRADVARERGEGASVTAALRADLAGHARALGDARAAHAETLRQAEEQRVELQRSASELRAELARMDAERLAVVADRDELLATLTRTRAEAGAIADALAGADAERERLAGELADLRRRAASRAWLFKRLVDPRTARGEG